ncbi:MAG TPA: hypothetical protein VGD74_12635 [Vulgatibacter sp.]
MKKSLTISFLAGALVFGLGAACGTDEDAPIHHGGTGGSGATGGSGGSGGSGGGGVGGTGGDACVNEQATCDECVSWEENPSLACSEHTGGCIPFDDEGRVPGFPNFPKVP